MIYEEELVHYGTPQPYANSPTGSGRYRKGTGENPYQHEDDFLETVNKLKKEGFTEKEIADYFGVSTTELREKKSIAKDQKRAADLAEAIKLYDQGYTKVAIAEKLGISEGEVRYLLNPVVQERVQKTETIANILKDRVDADNYIDVTEGSQLLIGVSKQKMNTAIQMLKDEGYKVQYLKIPQPNVPGKYTYIKVLTKDDVSYSDLYANRDKVQLIEPLYTTDGGKTFLGIEPPASVDSDRVQIRYAEDGGKEKDGVIELRRGVEDLSLGNSNYAQVRIAVDGTHYIKGMAIYSDDLPPGVDIIFNTNKSKNVPMLGPKDNTVLKPLKSDPDNPFGSNIKVKDGQIVGQSHYIDKDGNEKLSAINIVREEGDWSTWSNTLSSQFLSKQPLSLIKQQLNLTIDHVESDYDRIKALTNPEVKKKLLIEFADECDSKAVHLKAAALPRQSSKVIIPLTDLKDDECYDPNYEDGEQVVLIRHPHGGTFELPVLTVNNHISSGKKIIGKNASDAIGINSHVADRLSGADFDGDSVIVIPTKGQKIKATSPLKGLETFDPKESYPKYPGMKVMKNTQTEMGIISNLITDMTIKGAREDELVRAVKHSMVVIDAEKHELNYKQSYIDNNIQQLKEKYQPTGGASTLISRAGHEDYIPNTKPSKEGVIIGKSNYSIDPKTGKRLYSETGETKQVPIKNKKTGEITGYKTVLRTHKSPLMDRVDDAFTISSGYRKESEYATFANKLKAIANDARKEAISTPSTKVNPTAKKLYSSEVSSLKAKLNTALKNKPYERQAQLLANVIISAKKKDNPGMSNDELKKIKSQALNEARSRTGANKKSVLINITDSEWNAIQAGAISSTVLSKILDNTDPDRVRQLATPLEFRSPSTADIARIKDLSNRGYTNAQIAEAVGYSASTVANYI